MKKTDILEKVLETGTFLTFTALVMVVLLQVVTRFALPSLSFVWTEEASRFLFVYSVAFGAPLAMKKNEYVNVDILTSLLPKRVRHGLEAIIYLATVVLFSVVFIYGMEFAKLGVTQMSPTMGMPMTIAYSSITITAFCIIVYAIYNFVGHIANKKRGDTV